MPTANGRLHEKISAAGGFALSQAQAFGRIMAVAGSEHGEYVFDNEVV